jgi:membrane protease YdiL (CAAX protease family)
MRTVALVPSKGASALTLGTLAIAAAASTAALANPWPVVLGLLIAPALEEAAFRAGLQDGLLRCGTAAWRANLLTALAFSAAHMALRGVSTQTLLMLLPALFIGAAYNRWRRLRICIALHMAMNALWFAWQPLP